jgi:hypothetical protein
MTAFISIVLSDPTPPTVRLGGGNLPVIDFGHDASILLSGAAGNPEVIREFAASLLHLAHLKETAQDDEAMERAVAADPTHVAVA